MCSSTGQPGWGACGACGPVSCCCHPVHLCLGAQQAGEMCCLCGQVGLLGKTPGSCLPSLLLLAWRSPWPPRGHTGVKCPLSPNLSVPLALHTQMTTQSASCDDRARRGGAPPPRAAGAPSDRGDAHPPGQAHGTAGSAEPTQEQGRVRPSTSSRPAELRAQKWLPRGGAEVALSNARFWIIFKKGNKP